MEIITSPQNPKIKELLKLRKASKRKEDDLIIIEGHHELIMALEAGTEIRSLFLNQDFAKNKNIPEAVKNEKIYELPKELFKKVAYRENPDGFLALAKQPKINLSDIQVRKNALVIVLETVEKPGNLGAILRSADAAGVDAVLICDPQTDVFNPNAIRASLGAVFTNKVVTCRNEEAKNWLEKNKIKIYAATAHTDFKYTDINFKEALAIVIGTEHTGLSKFWRESADQQIKIPMKGKIDSLNASVSAAIILFEAIRQRG